MAETNDKPKTFQLERTTLWAPVEGNQRASLEFAIRNGYPRISVWPRTDSDTSKFPIQVAFDLEHFLIFLKRWEKIALDNTPSKEMMSVKHWPRDDAGNISGEKEVTGKAWIGKDEEGVVWISLQQQGRPDIRFTVELSDYHELIGSQGKPMTKAEGSVLRTMSLITILKEAFLKDGISFRDTSIPREKKGSYTQQKNKAGGSKGYQNKGYGQDSVTEYNLDSDVQF